MHGVDKSREMVGEYTEKGIETLEEISVERETEKSFLRELLLSLVEREK